MDRLIDVGGTYTLKVSPQLGETEYIDDMKLIVVDHAPGARAVPDAAGLKLLREAAEATQLSARGYHRVLRVARTLADLGGSQTIARLHVAEALGYRHRLASFRQAA